MALEQKSTTSKLVTGMAVGALVGAAAVFLDSGTRAKVADSTGEMKDKTVRMAQDVKNDPEGIKEDAAERVHNATNVLKEAIEDLQSLYNKTGNKVAHQTDSLKQDAQGLVSKAREDGTDLDGLGTSAQRTKEDTEELLSAAKEAGSDLEGLGAKVKEAKEELLKETSRSGSGSDGETDHTITDRPIQ
jgi:gas vesicle protein